MKIAIVDTLGLCYDGNTLKSRGLGGSESAVIYMAAEMARLGFSVTVFNNCVDSTHSQPGTYDGVRYIDNSQAAQHQEVYDAVVVSRTVSPFLNQSHPFVHTAGKRILWLHDTFIEGDHLVEELAVSGRINHIFTLSDWHTSYILNCDHGRRRNYEVLKRAVFQTRNGAVKYPTTSTRDANHFVYNASATKGMVPLLDLIWPRIRAALPNARLTVIGGYYRFRENAAPDQQEGTVSRYAAREDLRELGVTFTGIIPQSEIAEILSSAYMMLYPGAFPETYGISTLESLLYNTPLITTRFGALEETAVDLACYKIDYAIEPNSLFQTIDRAAQADRFVQLVLQAVANPYLHQQKQNYCRVVHDIAGWDTVALQWKQFLYQTSGRYLNVDEYRTVSRINDKVNRVFGRVTHTELPRYTSYGSERRIVVVSPFRNAADYLPRHIASVAQQDYDNYYHILIDDASTDNSFSVANQAISQLPLDLQSRFMLIKNLTNEGAIHNQLDAVSRYTEPGDIVMLLDGDDWLMNNNSLFHYYNDLYDRGYEFTYGSIWSVADNIPLVAQEYPESVRESKTYRSHLFNWKIPYTHLRTCRAEHFAQLDHNCFKTPDGEWMRSGHDNPLFYELIERVAPEKIYCNPEIVCYYNDINPLNDYKVRGEEQNRNASLSYAPTENAPVKKILIAIPTNKNIEAETYKSIYDLVIPPGYTTEFQYFFGYQIDQIRNLIADWGKRYDYLLCVDSDIVLPPDTLVKMLAHNVDIISGIYIQRKAEPRLEIYIEHRGGLNNLSIEDMYAEPTDLREVGGVGMGCCLIRGEVLRKMEYPHFVYQSALDHEHTFSEDLYFCRAARTAGFHVWMDRSIVCEHVGQTKYTVPPRPQSHLERIAQQDLLPRDHAAYLRQMNIQPQVIYDIGACVLHWTRKAVEVWPNANYVLFDGSTSVLPFLQASGLSYFNGILTDADQRMVDFYEDAENPGGNSYYRETTGAYEFVVPRRQAGYTLDTVASHNKWPLPDLIKIDAQGAELDILRGATQCLAHARDVILEAQTVDYNAGAPKASEVTAYMESVGFRLVSNFCQGVADGDYHYTRNV
jgi:FkbM family methyltransferase